MAANIDYLDSTSWEEGAILERTRWLREHDPVHWSEASQLWVLSRFAEVSYVSKHNKIFCSGEGVRPGNVAKIGLIDEDEPRHTRLRGLINKGFTPRMVATLEPALRAIVTETLDAVAPHGECDFVHDISVPIPLLIIAEMIGIRREDRRLFHQWSDALVAADGNLDRPEIMDRASKAFLEYSAYVSEIIEDRRARPKADLVSILVGAKDEGVLGSGDLDLPMATSVEHAQLANDELIMLMVLLMVAGNETTRNAISGGMQLLIEHPAERQKLLDDPSLLSSAIEEMLRLVSPVRQFARTATQDTELGGRTIKAGQKVLMIYPSANRDADVFDDPDTFRVERNPDHLAFGIGNHFCLGANLARMEMRLTFSEILRRMPDMEYTASGPVLIPAALVRNCTSMPVRFTPERCEELRAEG